MRGELDPPGLHELFGGDREKAKAALRDAWEKGIPLTYHTAVGRIDPETGKPFESAEEAFATLQSDIRTALAKAGVTDATVQQIGSGTTGWRGNPGTPKEPKPIAPWNPEKDTDFAVFSKQAQYQLLEESKQRGQAPAVNIPRDGKFTVFKNAPENGGFYATPAGQALHEVAVKWNKIVYDNADPKFDKGFDFKLNIPTKPFGKAVNVSKPELPTLSTQPAAPRTTTDAEMVSGKGTNRYLAVQVSAPAEMLKQVPAGSKGRVEYHVTLISPPEMGLLTPAAQASIANGVVLGGAPRLTGTVERGKLAYLAPVEWAEASAFRQSLELRPMPELEAAIHDNPSLAKSLNLSGGVPTLRAGDLHVTLTGGVNEAIESRGARVETPETGSQATAKHQLAEERAAKAPTEVPEPKTDGAITATDAAQRARAEVIAHSIGDDFKNHPLRQKYEAEVAAMQGEAESAISNAGGDREKLRKAALQMWQKRRDISTRYKEVTPELLRMYIYAQNERRYGDKLGPKWEDLEKRRSYEDIIRSSARPNPDINAFLAGFRSWLLTDGAQHVR